MPIEVWYNRPMAYTYRYCPQCAHRLEDRLVFGRVRQACPACDFIRFHDPKVGAATLIEREGRFLLLLRPPNDVFAPDTWGLPAGFMWKKPENCIGQQDVAVEKPQNQCHRACFTLEIAPQLPCRELGRLHDVADHYKKARKRPTDRSRLLLAVGMNGDNSGNARIAKQSFQDCRRLGIWGRQPPGVFPGRTPPQAAGFFTEHDESPQDAAIREAKEETGLPVETGELFGVYFYTDDPRGNGVLIVYRASVVGGELRAQREKVAATEWFYCDTLPENISGGGLGQAIRQWAASQRDSISG
jgi:hypothetical protein